MSSSSSWKPFCLGVLSASLVYMGVWAWYHEDFLLLTHTQDFIVENEDDEDLVSMDSSDVISKLSTKHSYSSNHHSVDLLSNNCDMNLHTSTTSNHHESTSLWDSMKEISRILTEKKTMNHSLQRWKWESIRKKIRKKASSTSIKLWESIVKKIEVLTSIDQHPPIHSFKNSVFQPIYSGNDTIDDQKQRNIHVSVAPSFSDDENIITWNTENIHNTEKSGLCIGSIFGLDVGGTLAKLVYFEKQPIHASYNSDSTSRQDSLERGVSERKEEINSPTKALRRNIQSKMTTQDTLSHEDLTKLLRARQSSMPEALLQFHHTHNSTLEQHHDDTIETIRKSRSMFNLVDGNERDIALSKFYTFANNLDSYASGMKENDLSFYSRALGGDFHFIQFETRRMQAALELIRISSFHRNILHIGATGGGAHRFSNEFEQVLGIKIMKQDELDSMVAGLQFALRDFPHECYTFVPDEDAIIQTESSSEESFGEVEPPSSSSNTEQEHSPVSGDHRQRRRRLEDTDQYWWSKKVPRDNSTTAKQYPYLVVMIGTGVSILRVDGPRKHERISGSTIGGGTYWGLCRLLTDAEDFQSALELAKRGDATKVDMLVGDIYGPNSGALDKLGLTANIVASSFGKLVSKQNPAEGLNQMDLARALLLMVTNNIGQVALLNARLHNTQRIFFIGNFLRHNIISQQRLAYSLAFWSQGKMEALFLEHEGYFGSLGAFLLSQGVNSNKLPLTSISQARTESRPRKDLIKSKRYRARSL